MTHTITSMPFRTIRLVATLLAFAAIRPADAQYFGRNKVQYERFDWRILKSDHFDLYFYPSESLKVHDAGRQSERWYTRLSDLFRHQFDRKSLVFYADHPDFQQTNVVSDQLSEGTGGVTEGSRTRVVMPWTGIYKDDEHVLGHELVHVFQYNIAETAPGQGGIARLGALPLWLIEGMAEYFSLGRNDALTAMWMRDAVMRDKFPTIKQLTTDPRFFPYRYGQALWAYVGGRWGDRAVVDVFRTSLRLGFEQALVRSLGLNSDSLSKDWAAANKAFYASQIAERTHPDSIGQRVVTVDENSDYNVSPALSADGKYVAYFTTRTNLFGIDLVLADATTGKTIRRLAGPQSDGHFDAISFINSSGAFSPDGSRFAFIVYSDGDSELTIVNTQTGKIQEELRPRDIGAIYNLAWSPDGKSLAFTGSKGGIGDLFLADIATGRIRQLTNDRYADMQPAFSADGRTLAFATDRGGSTSFERMTFGELQLATLDIETGQVTRHEAFARGKHTNPQFSPDGRNLYFVSDQDGVSDVYRLDLESKQVYRLTRVSTGVSGVTALSPALTVALGSGTMMFTIFRNQGNEIVRMDSTQLTGELVDVVAAARVASAAVLPPGDVAGAAYVATYLGEPLEGLPSGEDMVVVGYRPAFALDALGQPQIGVAVGGPFGSGLLGGVAALFGDQLSDQQIFATLNANGQVKDFGAGLFYLNLKRRWNWMAGGEHAPYLSWGQGFAGGSARCPDLCYYQIIRRMYTTQAVFNVGYPFSTTKRVEFGLGAARYAWEEQIDSVLLDPSGTFALGGGSRVGSPFPSLTYAQTTLALVGDNAFGAFTSPISGGRYRLEAAPTVGTVSFTSVRADMRKYFFARPFTFAVRGLHFGRYGRDADNQVQLSPMFLGDEQYVRGYDYYSLTRSECTAGNYTGSTCPVLERLLGSRLGVVNAEVRIPVFGTSSFGLIDFPYLPLEVSPFFDAGISWTGDQKPDLRYDQYGNNTPSCPPPPPNVLISPCAQRIPVFSTGVSFRFNVMGYFIFEAYYAKPFQRPLKNRVWGFQLAPGW